MNANLDLRITYQAILDAARQRRFISYGDLAKANGVEWQQVRYEMNRHLGELVMLAAKNGWPMPSAIVVNQKDLQTGDLHGSARKGFLAAAEENGVPIADPESFVREQQEAVFAWAQNAPDQLDLPDSAMEPVRSRPGPRFVQYFSPVLEALRALGGSAEPKDVIAKVEEIANVTKEELSETTKSGQSKFHNMVGWARFYLMKAGLIDGKKRGVWSLTAQGREAVLDHAAAMELFKDVQSRFSGPADAEEEEGRAPFDDAETDLFDNPDTQFWFVGAAWGTKDQTERFLAEGIWENGYDERFAEHVQRMKPGDRIAIKAAFVRKYGLPFDNQDIPVSCMRIKAIGTITEASQDGKTVKVDWTRLATPKDWYFYTYRVTIVQADPSEELPRRLIQFAFGDHKQDYEYWLRRPYFAKKYRNRSVTLNQIEREEEEAGADTEEFEFKPYEIADIVGDGCFLAEDKLDDALSRLRSKMNLILQGPPGTGKTWLAKRLGYALIGTKDSRLTRKRMRSIQFHPSLSYEDFVRGWRPNGDGKLSLIDGVSSKQSRPLMRNPITPSSSLSRRSIAAIQPRFSVKC